MSDFNIYYNAQRFVAHDVNSDGFLDLNRESFLDAEGNALPNQNNVVQQFRQWTFSQTRGTQIPLAALQLQAASRLAAETPYNLIEQISAHNRESDLLGTARTASLREEAIEVVQDNLQILQTLSSHPNSNELHRIRVALTQLQSALEVAPHTRVAPQSAQAAFLGVVLSGLGAATFAAKQFTTLIYSNYR